MTRSERVMQAIFNAVDEVNQQLATEQRLEKSRDTTLFGRSGKLDSLGLVNLIVATEQKIDEEFGLAITLTDDKALSNLDSIFQTIGTLVEYVSWRLEGKSTG